MRGDVVEDRDCIDGNDHIRATTEEMAEEGKDSKDDISATVVRKKESLRVRVGLESSSPCLLLERERRGEGRVERERSM